MKERLIEFLAYLGIGQNKFERAVGFSTGFVNKVGDSIREANLAKITRAYPELNISWLKTGEGDMIRKADIIQIADRNSIIGHGSTNISVALPEKGYQKIIKSDGSQTTVEVTSSGCEDASRDFVAENLALREEVGELKNKIIALQDRLLDGKK